ncbi:MAG: sigma-70 family RNA polymerase sigma factor [Planctomycetota bacterium]|nr:sigma-70 family RNA polymerase sigma factor [Planctomycetota bacterium]
MIHSKLLSNNKLNLRNRSSVSLEELDAVLDVAASSFERTMRRLATRLRRNRIEIDVAAYRQNRIDAVSARGPGSASQLRTGGFYQMDLRRYPAMDREEELRMARRYELVRWRMQLEVEACGIKREAAAELVRKSRSAIEAELGTRSNQGYLRQCLEELEQLRNLYVEGALHIVLSTVVRYRGLGVDSPDLIQEGNASLFQAIEGFDWRRNVRFKTYAQYWVRQAVLKALYNTGRTVRVPIWVQKMLGKIRKIQEEGRRQGIEYSHSAIGDRLGLTAEKVSWLLSTRRAAVSLDADNSGEDGVALKHSLSDDTVIAVPESVPQGNLLESLGEAMSDLPDREKLILKRRFGLGGSVPETLGDIAQDLGVTAERVRQLQNAALTRLQRPTKMRKLASFVE